MTLVRIVLWNIERGYYPEEAAEFLHSLDADIYALCELDRGVGRTQGIDMYTFLQKRIGFDSHYTKEFDEIPSIWRKIVPWGGSGGGEIGNALFSRFPIRACRSVGLSTKSPLTYDGSTWMPELFQPRRGSRQAQIADIETPQGPLTVVLTHTELWRSNWLHRRQQLEEALGNMQTASMIFTGDFNSVGGVLAGYLRRTHNTSEVLATRDWLESKGLNDPFSNDQVTCGRGFLRAKIDWLSLGRNFLVQSHTLHNTDLSDHSCLSVDFTIEPSSRA